MIILVKSSRIIHALDGLLSRHQASRDTTFSAPTAVRIIMIIVINEQRESESLGSKRPEREANQWPPSSTEVKKVGIATVYGPDGRGSIPGKGKRFVFSSPQRPYRLWGPLSLLTNV
jgi:hypothetical protein